ncbi:MULTISPECIES: flagellar motor switch protein FliG [Bacillaceae]|uniref:flagellar motor switch protein FliG n=1 Tax=Bacillales TaxID=1385 RepID=UPI001CFCE521|nr:MULTISPECIES: flagellar motor switch protein FliG [Bacillaceae]MDO6656351.1 flagellar motor switch protein FliG [Anaerobacillus sp. 1_MG-2023]WLR57814.1 flagellar motor switch protein FliG [Pseudalkalibacillus hwajinpoensis]
MVSSLEELTGTQKAAILLTSLGADLSIQTFKHLSEKEIDQLALGISELRKVEPDEREAVVDEFIQMVKAKDYIAVGGIEYARHILEQALGPKRAEEILSRLSINLKVKPFAFARKADPDQILNILQQEHPQTIALVLSYLDAKQSSKILSSLPQESQADVARRIALMDSTSPEVISQLEKIIEGKLNASGSQDYAFTGGVESIVQVLSSVDRSTERTILSSLEKDDPSLAEEIKKRMFVFEDIVTLDDRSIRLVISEVKDEDLSIALKVASDDVKDTIFRNMSNRRVDTVKEEIELMGPLRLREVEEAQTRIVSVIRYLEETGDVMIARGGGDDLIV